ncbi:hypothetical protein TraAM80_00200 [Trypanosoma rangeli]|uniref:Uncharacterized protein n=1 Tax=Trypanosoma rangeli TaxID=5698 RepID=A0A3R7MC60_TRYRA|nr:uncharacterized protein TraAM80_00200 [Trypanosoma rangeli]RNF12656.1 hypothetical protein TraAM80_00200 [Trypanosoma rangeli]|eukprot:RNF12656.1 hypothetical protein TraAM80_00200 [Trypanosoma rangeli]
MLLLYYLYYVFKRPREVAASTIAPFLIFMNHLTDGATAGYDKPLMSLFHPELLKDVERGLIRAMARCLCKHFGKVVHVPRDTAMLRSRDDDVSFVALVDFQHVRQVKCRMSWRWCPPKGVYFAMPVAQRHFQVTGFHVEPQSMVQFDVLEFLHTEDFVPFAGSFVEKLFERPPKAAVMMMAPPLQERYLAELEKLQNSIQRVCGSAPESRPDVNARLVSETILRDPASSGPSCANLGSDSASKGAGEAAEDVRGEKGNTCEAAEMPTKRAVRGIEMHFVVGGVGLREVEVTVVLSFSGLRCHVIRYEVRAQPDTRTHILLDQDTGEKTFVA